MSVRLSLCRRQNLPKMCIVLSSPYYKAFIFNLLCVLISIFVNITFLLRDYNMHKKGTYCTALLTCLSLLASSELMLCISVFLFYCCSCSVSFVSDNHCSFFFFFLSWLYALRQDFNIMLLYAMTADYNGYHGT